MNLRKQKEIGFDFLVDLFKQDFDDDEEIDLDVFASKWAVEKALKAGGTVSVEEIETRCHDAIFAAQAGMAESCKFSKKGGDL